MFCVVVGMKRIRKALEEIKRVTASPDAGQTKEAMGKRKENTPEGAHADLDKAATVNSTSSPENNSTEEAAEKVTPASNAIPLASEDFVLLDCQTSHPTDNLDSLIGALRQQIHSSDWLEKNTPELSAGEDPELLDVFKDLLDRARR